MDSLNDMYDLAFNYAVTLKAEFETLLPMYYADISIEEYTYLVDIRFRKEYDCFPVGLLSLFHGIKTFEERLQKTCEQVSDELINGLEYDIMKHEEESKMEFVCEQLEFELEEFLNYQKRYVIDHGFPFNRRFKRESIWVIASDILSFKSTEECTKTLDLALDKLTKNGILQFIERGYSPKHDVFEALVL